MEGEAEQPLPSSIPEIDFESHNLFAVLRTDLCIDIYDYGIDITQFQPNRIASIPFADGRCINWSASGMCLAEIRQEKVLVRNVTSSSNETKHFNESEGRFGEFSPGENYLVLTCENSDQQYSAILKIVEMKTGVIRKTFDGLSRVDMEIVTSLVDWPVIRWFGGDDKFFARFGTNVLSVYDTETFSPVAEFENVRNFSCSPANNILATFGVPVDGCDESPSVKLLEIPSKKVLWETMVVEAQTCEVFWQSNGDYVAFLLDKSSERLPGTCATILIFIIEGNGATVAITPVQLLGRELDSKIVAFSWEPKGHRFSVAQAGSNIAIDLYSLHGPLQSPLKLTSIREVPASFIFWSPVGRFLVIVGLTDQSGHLTFYDADESEVLATQECMAMDVQWDTLGRFVATRSPPFTKNEGDTNEVGMKIWSYSGELLYQIEGMNLSQFCWRPTPNSRPFKAHAEEKAAEADQDQ